MDKKGQELAPELIVGAPQKQEGKEQLVSGRIITIDLGKGVEMELVYIPPGKFMMGVPSSEDPRSTGDRPQHRVKITRGFYLGKYEVTQAQYEAVMGNNPSKFKGAKNPVECVSWDDAVEFCGRLSKKTGKEFRLPTEAEWEYACRAGTITAYVWGDKFELNRCNAENDYGAMFKWRDRNARTFRKRRLPISSTMPVGTFSPNAFGLYDMHGNVWEWCSDWFHGGYYQNSPYEDPKGPTRWYHMTRVLRGGAWSCSGGQCRSANRHANAPATRNKSDGFRCALWILKALPLYPFAS